MNQRTRYFLVGSALTVLVGLGTGLVAFYNGGLPMAGSSRGPAELAYVPADAVAVAYADVHGIMNSEFRQRLRQVLPSGEEKDKLQAEIGVDLERDVDSVVAGLSSGGVDPRGAVVLVRGRFDANLIESKAVAHGARVEDYRGKRMIILSDGPVSNGAATGGVAFLEPGLIALGETSSIKRAIEAGDAGTGAVKSADLMKLVSEVDQTSSAWVVGRVDAMMANPAVPQELKEHLPAVQWVSASAHIDGTVSGQLHAVAADEKSGEQLRDVVRGGLAAAQLVAGKDPTFDSMMQSLQISGTGKALNVSFTVPAHLLDMLNGVAGLGLNKLSTMPEGIRK